MEEDLEVFSEGDIKYYGIPKLTAIKNADNNIILHLESGNLFAYKGGSLELKKSSLYEENVCGAVFKIKPYDTMKQFTDVLDDLQNRVIRTLVKNSSALFKKKLSNKDINAMLEPFYDVEKEEITFEIYTDGETGETFPMLVDDGKYKEGVNAQNFSLTYPEGTIFTPIIVLRYLQYDEKAEIITPIVDLFHLYHNCGKKAVPIKNEEIEIKKEEIPIKKEEITIKKEELIIETAEESESSSSSSSSSDSDSESDSGSDSESEEEEEEESESEKRRYALRLMELEAEKEKLKLLQMEKEEKKRKEEKKKREEKKKTDKKKKSTKL